MLNLSQNYSIEKNDKIDNTKNIKQIQPYFQLIISNKNKNVYLKNKKNRKLKKFIKWKME